MREALLVVDLQNDFCSGGALAMPDAEALIPLANRLLERATTRVLQAASERLAAKLEGLAALEGLPLVDFAPDGPSPAPDRSTPCSPHAIGSALRCWAPRT